MWQGYPAQKRLQPFLHACFSRQVCSSNPHNQPIFQIHALLPAVKKEESQESTHWKKRILRIKRDSQSREKGDQPFWFLLSISNLVGPLTGRRRWNNASDRGESQDGSLFKGREALHKTNVLCSQPYQWKWLVIKEWVHVNSVPTGSASFLSFDHHLHKMQVSFLFLLFLFLSCWYSKFHLELGKGWYGWQVLLIFCCLATEIYTSKWVRESHPILLFEYLYTSNTKPYCHDHPISSFVWLFPFHWYREQECVFLTGSAPRR